MNKLRLILSLVIVFITAQLTAQELPQAINFQAIARDANGQPLANTNIMLQLSVIDGTPEGPVVYREIRSLPTNLYGGFNFQVGREPNVADGVFAEIDWANGRKFLKVDYDPTNTMSFNLSLGTIEFVSVPYAFVAGKVPYINADGANDGDVLVFNEVTGQFEPQTISISGITEETDPTVPAWAKEDEKPTYDYSEILNTPEIPEIPENVSAFINDAGYITFADIPAITEVPENVSAFNNDAGYITSADIPAIPEVPENVSAFTNDAGYITSANIPAIPEVPENVSAFNNDAGYITSADVPEIPENVSAFTNDAGYITSADIPAIPEVPENVSAFTNDAGYITSAEVPEIPEIPENVSAFNNDAGYITSADIPAIPEVPENVSVFNNDAGYITSADVPEIPENVSAFTNDAGYITSADIPAIPEVPENVSAFTNDAGYITSADIPAIPEIPENVSVFTNDAGYITSSDVPEIPENVSAFTNDAGYITSADIPAIPEVPTNVSAFTNDANYITSADIPTNVSAFTNDAGYLTELQALSMSGDTVFLTGGSYVVLPEEMQTLSDVVANGNSANAQLKNVVDPTEAQDAVTLAYLDAKIAELNEKIEQLQELMNVSTPEGGINGLFSISESTRVFFSKGNLQYQASTNTWRFAEHQWDTIGADNANISPTYNGWIDLFGWGTGNNPANSSTSNSDYGTFIDWGTNPISNGGNNASLWRTLTKEEWNFLLFSRITTSGIRFAKATVNGVSGVIILPDNWSTSYYTLSSTNSTDASFSTNSITYANWSSKFESHGAVFLPAAGIRNGTSAYSAGKGCFYWSSSSASDIYSSAFELSTANGYMVILSYPYYSGFSVRLVQYAN